MSSARRQDAGGEVSVVVCFHTATETPLPRPGSAPWAHAHSDDTQRDALYPAPGVAEQISIRTPPEPLPH